MSKYKVGDRVRVREDLADGAFYGSISASRAMKKMKGEVVTIERTLPYDRYVINSDEGQEALRDGDAVRIKNKNLKECGKIGSIFRAYKTHALVTLDGKYATFFNYEDIESIPDDSPDDADTSTVQEPDKASAADTLDSIADIIQDYSDAGSPNDSDAPNKINKRLTEHFIGYGAEPPELIRCVPDDAVNHPAHYNHGGIETDDIIRMLLTPEEYAGWLKGNVIKYRDRAPWKHETPDEDWAKARVYYDKYIESEEL